MSSSSECPTCGCDVSGCTETIDTSGRRRWTQPIKHDSHMDGRPRLAGGLVHIEHDTRCAADANVQERSNARRRAHYEAATAGLVAIGASLFAFGEVRAHG